MQKNGVVVLAGKEYNTIISNEVEDKENDYDKSTVYNKIAYQCISAWKEMLNTINSYDPCSGAYCFYHDNASTIMFEWPKIYGNISGIACHSNGNCAVVNFSKSHVYILNAEHNIINDIDVRGKCARPAAVAFDVGGNLYVTDIKNGVILTYDHYGNFLFHFGGKESGDGKLKCPIGISVHRGFVYIADSHNGCIAVFQTDGKFHRAIGKGVLGKPHDVCVDNQIAVADMGHKCVYIFTITGDYLMKYSSTRHYSGKLYRPHCLTMFNSFIFVVDSYNHKVLAFNASGVCAYRFSFGSARCCKIRSPPQAVAVSPQGTLIISDHHDRCIHEFPISEFRERKI
ncbi:tripartite motif-containing protein 2-like [Dysidea avara]|uniref:tripartite motif-containing protein 2-like n=1 Tax=Dysidea avara TaxID=196820 RepID=UPI003324C1FF